MADANPPPTGDRPGRLSLSKHHGLGNDFLIAVDPAWTPGGDEARRWCDRHVGVGADGLLVATPLGDAPTGGPRRHWRMVLWNADGGRAEISGNGIRCLGQAVADTEGLDPSQDQELTIETDAGTRGLLVTAQEPPRSTPPSTTDVGRTRTASTVQVRAGMGKAVEGPAPSRRWDEVGVPVVDQRGVDLGNPHLVAFVEAASPSEAVDVVDRFDMAEVGPVVEADYPGGCNVHLVAVAGPDRLALRVWERGAGVTQACGSGACAAAWAANAAGLVGTEVTVDMPGGSAVVTLTPDEILLTGPAVRVAEVIIDG
ncbi:MAG: diaminopimelate epimerase [Actinomycetota bacterium]